MTSWSVYVLLLATALAGTQANKPSVDISGTWAIDAKFTAPPGMPAGGFRATITIKQRGNEFDGDFRVPSASYGGPFTGMLKGKELAFTVTLKNPRLPGVIDRSEFSGTLVDDKTIKGYVKSSSKGPGTDMGAEGSYVAIRRRSKP